MQGDAPSTAKTTAPRRKASAKTPTASTPPLGSAEDVGAFGAASTTPSGPQKFSVVGKKRTGPGVGGGGGRWGARRDQPVVVQRYSKMSVLQCFLTEFATGGVSVPQVGNAARAIAAHGIRFGADSATPTFLRGHDLIDFSIVESGSALADRKASTLSECEKLLRNALKSCVDSEVTDSAVMPARASSVMVSETIAAVRSSLESFEAAWAEAVTDAQRKQRGPWEAGTAFLSTLTEADKITLADVPSCGNLLLNPFDSALYTPKQWSWTAKDVSNDWVPEVRSSVIAERLSREADIEAIERKSAIASALKSLDEKISSLQSLSSYRNCIAKAVQLLSTGYAPMIFDFPSSAKDESGKFMAGVHRAKLVAEVIQESMVSFGDSVAQPPIDASGNATAVASYKPRKYNGTFGPILIVTKVGEVFDWAHLFSALFPDHRVLPYVGAVSDREAMRCFLSPSGLYTERSHCHIVVTHYESYLQDIRYLRPIKWHAVVMDSCLSLMSNSEYCDPVHDASMLIQCRHRIYSSPYMCSPDRHHLPDPLSCLKWLAPALHKILMDADGVIMDDAPLGALEDRLLRVISSLTCVCNGDFDSYVLQAQPPVSVERQIELSKLCDSMSWAAWFGLQLVRHGDGNSGDSLVFRAHNANTTGPRIIYSPPFTKQFVDTQLDAEMKFVTLALDSASIVDDIGSAGPKVAPFCPFIAITTDQKMQRKRSRTVMADGSEAIISAPADERKVVVLDDGRIIKRRKRRTKLELMQAAANGELKLKRKPGPKPKGGLSSSQPQDAQEAQEAQENAENGSDDEGEGEAEVEAEGAEVDAEAEVVVENETPMETKVEEKHDLVSPSKRARLSVGDSKTETPAAVATETPKAAIATAPARRGRRSTGAPRKVVNALSGETLGPEYEAEFQRSVSEHNGRWKVLLEVPGRTKFLGTYPTREAAEEVFKSARVLRAELLKNAVVDESAHRKGKFKGRTLKELPLSSMSNDDIYNSIRNMAIPQRSVSGESGAFYGPDPGPVAYAMCYGLEGFAAPVTRLPTKLGKLRPSAIDLAGALGIVDPKGLGSRGDVDIHLGNDASIAHNHAVIEYNFLSSSYEITPLVRAGVYIDGQLQSEVGVAIPLRSGSVIQIGCQIFYFMLPVVTETHQDRLRRGCVLESQSPTLQLMLLYDALAGSIKLRKSMLALEGGFDEAAFEAAEQLMDTVVASQDRALSQLTLSSVPMQPYRPPREESARVEGESRSDTSIAPGDDEHVNALYQPPMRPEQMVRPGESNVSQDPKPKPAREAKPKEPRPPKEAKPKVPKAGENVKAARPVIKPDPRSREVDANIAQSIAAALAAHVSDFDNSGMAPNAKRQRPAEGSSMGPGQMQAQAQSLVAALHAQQRAGGIRPTENVDDWAVRRAAMAFHGGNNANHVGAGALASAGFMDPRMQQYAGAMNAAVAAAVAAGLPYPTGPGAAHHPGLLNMRNMLVGAGSNPMGSMQGAPQIPPFHYLGGAPQVGLHALSQQEALRNASLRMQRPAFPLPNQQPAVNAAPTTAADSSGPLTHPGSNPGSTGTTGGA